MHFNVYNFTFHENCTFLESAQPFIWKFWEMMLSSFLQFGVLIPEPGYYPAWARGEPGRPGQRAPGATTNIQ